MSVSVLYGNLCGIQSLSQTQFLWRFHQHELSVPLVFSLDHQSSSKLAVFYLYASILVSQAYADPISRPLSLLHALHTRVTHTQFACGLLHWNIWLFGYTLIQFSRALFKVWRCIGWCPSGRVARILWRHDFIESWPPSYHEKGRYMLLHEHYKGREFSICG